MALEEKAVSKAQQRFMGMVHAYQKGELKGDDVSKSVKKAAKSMTKKAAKDFAKTKHKGLPNHVDEEFKISKKNIMLKEEPMPAPGPNATGAMPVQTPAPTKAPDAIDKEKENADNITKQQAASGKEVGINPPQGDEEQQTNNDNNTQGQPADAAAANQAQAPVQESLSEADLKYISRKALSILREWTK